MACYLPLSAAKPVMDVAKSSDTMSEVSENGTVTSEWTSKWDSREDLRDLVTRLGLTDLADLHQERFRVDRTKLEKMLTGDNEALFPADVFFAKVMEDTDTIITWPNKLKIGAKSKKDPHVRIAGRADDVQMAKERILSVLNTRCNRVTMKMDVSYTDHSHIIGKGGLSIKRVMEETRCHVHFPDSNRSNPNEKSNQVSISGDLDGVERARSRVRELIPLIFGFELPIMSKNVDVNSPYVTKIQEQYRVQVMFKTRPKLHATLVLVKGLEWEVCQVKHATLLLMEYMCDNLASQIPVQMSMEISPHHHQIVLAKNHTNLKTIMQYTSCQIMFPDAQDPNIPTLKKSNVTITGNIHNVYKARQLLMGSLPLIIIFDLPDDVTGLRVKPEQISEIQSTCDVVINIRPKANKTTKACVIKGIERLATNIYKARNLILGVDYITTRADVPASYHMPNLAVLTQPNEVLASTNAVPAMSPLLSPLVSSPSWYFPSPTVNQQTHAPPFVGMTQQQHFFPSMSMVQHNSNSSGYQSATPNVMDQNQEMLNANSSSCSASSLSTISSAKNSPVQPVSPNCYRNYPESPAHTQYSHSSTTNVSEFATALSEMNNPGEYHGPTLDKKMSLSPGDLTPYEYENKRLAGLRAMQALPNPGSMRVPNNSWSGYGISQTSPGGFLVDKFRYREDEIWKPNTPRQNSDMMNMPSTSSSAMLNTSNLLDHTPTHVWNRVNYNGNWQDMSSILTALKLDHYVPVFKQHEIDSTIFSTLTDKDLVDIGITAFGARRRILLAISEMNKRNVPFSAAPGAERKGSSSSSNGTNGSPRNSTNW
ncbi:protein bicaudal C [Sitophilus oryzae]|uniref:Protein bicaudal C n=1 Tax=Sitophilus oryzae TaxID=7048 RepID=A0A6J2XS17_SITOR|nr:protein bicaudal C [Sitophilus oryzae]